MQINWGKVFLVEVGMLFLLFIYFAFMPSYQEKIQRGFHQAICHPDEQELDSDAGMAKQFINADYMGIGQKVELDRTGIFQ